MYVIKQVVDLLELERYHDLLDVGCGNGLVDIPLSALVRTIVGVEPVLERLELGLGNLRDCHNVHLVRGHGAKIPAQDASFDRVLILNVIQLVTPQELQVIVRELNRVTRPGALALIASVPDGRKREEVIGPYLEGVRSATHLSEKEKIEIIRRNEAATWHHPDDLSRMWDEEGWKTNVLPLLPGDPNYGQRYHMVARRA
jgi:ubiquinone/menaquinone biosynthesis C-methylase UbiE